MVVVHGKMLLLLQLVDDGFQDRPSKTKNQKKKTNEMQHIQFMHYLALTVILVVIWNIIPM